MAAGRTASVCDVSPGSCHAVCTMLMCAMWAAVPLLTFALLHPCAPLGASATASKSSGLPGDTVLRLGMGHGRAEARTPLAGRLAGSSPQPLPLPGGACSCGDSTTAMPTPRRVGSGVCADDAAAAVPWPVRGDANSGADHCRQDGGARGSIASAVAGDSPGRRVFAGGPTDSAGLVGDASGVLCVLEGCSGLAAPRLSRGSSEWHSWERTGDGVLHALSSGGITAGIGRGSICTASGISAGCALPGAVAAIFALQAAASWGLLAGVAACAGQCCCAARLTAVTSSCSKHLALTMVGTQERTMCNAAWSLGGRLATQQSGHTSAESAAVIDAEVGSGLGQGGCAAVSSDSHSCTIAATEFWVVPGRQPWHSHAFRGQTARTRCR